MLGLFSCSWSIALNCRVCDDVVEYRYLGRNLSAEVGKIKAESPCAVSTWIFTSTAFWFKAVSGAFLSLSLNPFQCLQKPTGLKKPAVFCQKRAVFVTCRKLMSLQSGRVKSPAFIHSCTYPFTTPMLVLCFVLPDCDLQFHLSKAIYTPLIFKHTTIASAWRQKLESY